MSDQRPASELTLISSEELSRIDLVGNPMVIHNLYEDENGEEYWGLEVAECDKDKFAVCITDGGDLTIVLRSELDG